MIASERLNLGTALAHLQNLSREFETLEAASIKARIELDQLTRFLEQATVADDETLADSTATPDTALASLDMTRADGTIADNAATAAAGAPARATSSDAQDSHPDQDSLSAATTPGEDLETAFYRTVADLFAPIQQEDVHAPQVKADTDGLDYGPSDVTMRDEADDVAITVVDRDLVSEVVDDEPLLDLFAEQNDTILQDDSAEPDILEVSASHTMNDADGQPDQEAETARHDLVREVPDPIRHDPQLFGFQDTSLATAPDCPSDIAGSDLLSDAIDAQAATVEIKHPEAAADDHSFDEIASLFDSLTEELNLAADTTDLVDEDAPKSVVQTDPEPTATDLALSASDEGPDEQPFVLEQTSKLERTQPAQAEQDVGLLDNMEQPIEPEQPELDAPTAATFTNPELTDALATSPVRDDEPNDEQGPVECFSAMHQPISFEEPQIEDLVIANVRSVGAANESDPDELDAAAAGSIAIDVATIQPIASSNEETPETALACESSEAPVKASATAEVLPTAVDEAGPDESVQDLPGDVDTPAATTEQTQTEIVLLPIADEGAIQPTRARGRATTIAGLGAIAATLAVALHPPIAEELLSLPWQDMLHMNDILDKLSELKRFFALA